MRIELSARRSRVVFLAAVAAAAAVLAIASGKAWLAERWNASTEPTLWHKAARAEPGDARYWVHLGRYAQSNLTKAESGRAVNDFRRAAVADPASGGIWLELAGADESLGRPDRARRAFERALADDPLSPRVAWRYGNFLLGEKDFGAGYTELRRALAGEPSLTESAISECEQAGASARDIVDRVLPPEAGSYLTAVDFFVSRQKLDAALTVWPRLLALSRPVALRRGLPLVNALVAADRLADADRVWRQTLAAADWPRSSTPDDSLVFNGGFEHPLAGGGFGWREIPADGVTYALDRSVGHSGRQSLEITFAGTANLDFRNLVQSVRVQPGTRYRFSAFLRTEQLSTDSGIRFLLFDVRHPAALAMLTPEIVGTHAWEKVSAKFTTGSRTDLLRIALRRLPSQKFDNKLAGRVWVDDVALTAVGQSRKRGTK